MLQRVGRGHRLQEEAFCTLKSEQKQSHEVLCFWWWWYRSSKLASLPVRSPADACDALYSILASSSGPVVLEKLDPIATQRVI